MATMSMAPVISSESTPLPFTSSNFKVAFWNVIPGSHNVPFCNIQESFPKRLSYANQPGHRNLLKPISAASSERGSILDRAEIVVESRDEDKLRLRVDLAGEDTQLAVDRFFEALKTTVPMTEKPGPRQDFRTKATVPGIDGTMSSILVLSKLEAEQILLLRRRRQDYYKIDGDSVNIYVIKKMIASIVKQYLAKENLSASRIFVDQTHAELAGDFYPGVEFGFNVVLDLVKEEAETASSDS